MARRLSEIAPDWRDYTTLESELLEDAAGLIKKSLKKLARPRFSHPLSFAKALFADHPNLHFHFYHPGLGVVAAELH